MSYITAEDCIRPILKIIKTDSPDPVWPENTLTYVITVTNTGSVNATGVTIVDDYNQSILTITNTDGGIDNGDTITWNGGITISAGGQISYTVTATVRSTAPRGSKFYNTATVTYTGGPSDSVTIDTTVGTYSSGDGGGGGGGGGGGLGVKYLTVDWDGLITSKRLYGNDRLAVDLLGPSTNGMHSLLLKRTTHAPIVDGKTHYLIIIRELEGTDIPPLPENIVAIVAFNITPENAAFDQDIFMTLGLDQLQLPGDIIEETITIAYYDEVNGVWVPLETEPGEPNGVAELILATPINHFTIFGVLAELAPITPPPPAHFVASGLNIVPGVEKTIFVTKTGESVTITANVVNDGWQEGTYTVVLKLNGQTVDTKTVTLGAGQSKQVSFTQSGLDYGQYEVEVAGLSGDFTASRTITWWLIIVLIAALGLIIWGVVRIRRGRKAPHKRHRKIKRR